MLEVKHMRVLVNLTLRAVVNMYFDICEVEKNNSKLIISNKIENISTTQF